MIYQQLREELDGVTRRYRRLCLWWALSISGFAASLVGAGLLLLGRSADWTSSWSWPVLLGIAFFSACMLAGFAVRFARNPGRIARLVEAAHPDLECLLLAAVEQRPELPEGRFGFLQESVIREAVAHSRRHDWEAAVPERRIRAAQVAALTALGLVVAVCGGLAGSAAGRGAKPDSLAGAGPPRGAARYEVAVEPGDTEIERGTSLIVTARFDGQLPDDATLVYRDTSGETMRLPMSLSLSDPMFGGRVTDVDGNLSYHVEYADQATRDFRVTVFEHPRLERADVRLVFPEYTSLQERRVEDTRRVTAVEGTELTLFCDLNKPVERAHLVDEGGVRLELAGEHDGSTTYWMTMTLKESGRYRLHLVDAEGRRNKQPPEFVFNVTPNRQPDVTIVIPARDVRVSPIEELQTQASVWDDFGLRAVGITLSLAGQPPEEVALGEATARNARQEVEHLIDFEALEAEPDQLLFYYFWAEDVGPDGMPRRTLGDMYFAEVRHFEEIFRRGEQPPGGDAQQQQKGDGNAEQAQELAELQKQIINATWTVIRREVDTPPTDEFAADAGQLRGSQQAAFDRAAALVDKVRDTQSKEHVGNVLRHMAKALKHLSEAVEASAPEALQPALAAEQAAYQALLKLRAREHQVIRSRRRQAGQRSQSASGPQSRAQRQLEQLELKESENRYETQRTAARREDEAQRETRQVLNRLRELARRQSDLNQRLKELQSALEEAETEREREEIRRRLKRLRDEQQEILRDTDELRQRLQRPENQERMAESRRDLDQTRENIRQTTEALKQGQVSQALASGTRAERQLKQMREEFRKRASNRFSEEVKRLRDDARALHQNESKLAEGLRDLARGQSAAGRLRDPSRREELREGFREQREDLDRLLEDIRQTVEEAEQSEPLMTEKLYDALREAHGQRLDDALDVTRTLLDRGFLDQARLAELQAGRGIEGLKEGVEKAAESVLGGEEEALRRAHEVLEDLADQVNEEIGRGDPKKPPRGESADEAQSAARDDSRRREGGRDRGRRSPGPIDLERFITPDDRVRGPITGDDFLDWSDRLRDVEEMIEDPGMRAEAARIRDAARGLRRQLRGGSQGPNWDLIREFVAEPLNELRDRVAEELLRRGAKQSTVPIDRDPVPSKYVEQVRRYYEELGRGR